MTSTLRKLVAVPLPFFGLALWRAWVNASFAVPNASIPLLAASSQAFFDAVMALAYVVAIVAAGRISPLCARRWPLVACPVLMCSFSAAALLSVWFPGIVVAAAPLTALAAVGAVLMILLWSELYAGLSPFWVLLALTGSYCLGPVVVFVLDGFVPSYQAGAVALLPVLSMLCLLSARSKGGYSQHLRRTGKGAIPFRAIAVLALYGMVSGLMDTHGGKISGTNSSLTAFLVSGTLFLLLSLIGSRLSISGIQKVPPMLMTAALVLVVLSALIGGVAPVYVGVLITSSYLLSYFFVDAILCDVSRRFGISAVWLFSIAGAVETAAGLVGQQCGTMITAATGGALYSDTLRVAIVVAIALVCAFFLLDGKALRVEWGVAFAEAGELSPHMERREKIRQWTSDAARDNGLTPRETEILEFIASGESMGSISRKLVVSESTIKSHASHIYDKLGIRGKKELAAILEREGVTGDATKGVADPRDR